MTEPLTMTVPLTMTEPLTTNVTTPSPFTTPSATPLPMERPALIGLTGYRGAGKASVGDVLAQHGYRTAAFDAKVRELAGLLSADMQPSEPSRVSSTELREAVQAVFGPDVWLDATLPRVSSPFGRLPFTPEDPVAVIDVHRPAEARRIRNLGGVIWRVVRPGVGPSNESDARALSRLRPDATVCNTGTLSDLHSVVELMLSHCVDPPQLMAELTREPVMS